MHVWVGTSANIWTPCRCDPRWNYRSTWFRVQWIVCTSCRLSSARLSGLCLVWSLSSHLLILNGYSVWKVWRFGVGWRLLQGNLRPQLDDMGESTNARIPQRTSCSKTITSQKKYFPCNNNTHKHSGETTTFDCVITIMRGFSDAQFQTRKPKWGITTTASLSVVWCVARD